ncbi:MAG: hypothetical protein P8077_03925, partial [Gammaproteobacteria bacterium]
MLFEKVLNRHKNSYINDLVFPSIIFPVLMIAGLCLLLLIPILLYLGRDVFYNLPSLTFACGTSGMGLIVGSVFVGHFWGLIIEKRKGVVRKNYNALMNWYIFVLIILWAWPLYFAAAFFSQYPVQGYRSYIIDMKPTPEVKAEIEKLGLYEIKRHTPYDYSLDRQTIRYDFLNKIDVRVFDTKNNAFFHCSDSEFKNSKFKINFDSDRVNAFLKKVNKSSSEYPVVIKHQEKYKCAIKVEFKKPFPDINKQVGLADGLKLFPLLTDGLNVYYDASPAFKIYESFRSHELCVKKVWDRN